MLSHEQIDGLMKFAQEIAIPILLFRAISQLDLTKDFDISSLVSFYSGALICFLLGTFAARVVFKRCWEDSIVIGFTALFSNSVLLGLSVADRAFGAQALAGTYSIIAFHAPFCYFLGIVSFELVRARQAISNSAVAANIATNILKNAILLAMVAGFAFNLLKIPLHDVISAPMDLLAKAALPTALFGLGGVLYRYRPEGDLKIVLTVCAISLLVHPSITWVSAKLIFSSAQVFVQAAVVPAAMAPGVNAYIFANMYKHGERIAASSILIGTLLSVATASMWLLVLS